MAVITIQTKNRTKRLQVAGSLGGKPVLEELTIIENGSYTPAEGVDGFSSVTVNVEKGSSDADVVYITFMSYDGATELYKKPVVVGDDSFCPVTTGVIDTPVKESTAEYNYTFAGWATTANGGLDSNALKAVTEDRVVYANYAAVTRYYTVRFYDGDTLLKTEILAYGATPTTYLPEKEGYNFAGWQPEIAAVTGDADYHAQFTETPTFAGSSWAKIIEVAQSGQAAEYFAVGDERTEVITYADGTSEEITWVVADFGKCTVQDADGNATTDNMTIVAKHALASARKMHSDTSKYKRYHQTELNTFLKTEFFNALPTALQAGIMPYSLVYAGAHTPVWIPNRQQLETTSHDSNVYHYGSANILQLFSTVSNRTRTLGKNGAACEWWSATLSTNSNLCYIVGTSGSVTYNNTGVQLGVVPAFCI